MLVQPLMENILLAKKQCGSIHHNYKRFFCIVPMGLVNADYKYLCLEVGGHRYMSDAQMFNESELKDCLVNGTIGLPPVDALITERDMLEDDDSAALLEGLPQCLAMSSCCVGKC